MPALWHMIVARIRAFFRAGDLDRDFERELEAHLELSAAEKIGQGMPPEQARRAARLELGGVTQLREASREVRGLPWLDTFWLDIKLGLRMLRKSWGLTLVGGLAMTIAMVIGLVVFTFFDLVFGTALPLDEGERVVAIQTWDREGQRRHGTSMRDLERWRDHLRSVTDVGAFRTVERNMTVGDASTAPVGAGRTEPVAVAEMTASGFRVARVPPLLGRTLVDTDALGGAEPVVVIGHDVWQSRFSADPEVVGRTVRLGDTVHTVVGVMPDRFAFPVDHRLWTPLRLDRSGHLSARREGAVFARLAPGATLESAETELAALGLLPSSDARPDAREVGRALEARVVPYTHAFTVDGDHGQVRWAIRLALFFVALLLVPPCANIAILVYARTVNRQTEFAARHALGASRARIVGQLFVEMLVLAAAAAGMALVIVQLAVRWAAASLAREASGAPFWMDFTLSYKTVLFAAALAVLAAAVAGLLPALKATGRQMRSGLQTLGNRTGMRLGATWTALVVVQVGLCLAALPFVAEMTWGTIRKGVLGPGFAAEGYLTARLTMDREMLAEADGEPRSFASRFGARQTELLRRLRAEPGVSGVTVAALPGDEPWVRIEIDGGARTAPSLVRVNHVDDAFFDVLDVAFMTGRGFGASDFDSGAAVAIVNRTFADQLLGDGNPLGRRIRYAEIEGEDVRAASASQDWYEIVGVVADRPANVDRGTFYLPVPAGSVHPASLALRVMPDPAAITGRLRSIATAIDPTMRVDEIATLDEVYREKAVGNNIGAASLAAVALSVLLLSAAGMYALMSFTVNRRRREIGIRSALGARPQHLVAGIFKRALAQLAVGAAGGLLVASLLAYYLPAEALGGWSLPGVIPAATVFMVLIGLLAAAGPARRALRVEPIEELRNG